MSNNFNFQAENLNATSFSVPVAMAFVKVSFLRAALCDIQVATGDNLFLEPLCGHFLKCHWYTKLHILIGHMTHKRACDTEPTVDEFIAISALVSHVTLGIFRLCNWKCICPCCCERWNQEQCYRSCVIIIYWSQDCAYTFGSPHCGALDKTELKEKGVMS